MSRTIATCLLAATVLLLTGCKNDSESLASDMLDDHKEMLSILKGVTDKASAKAAGPKIEALGKRMEERIAKVDLKQLKSDEMAKAKAKYAADREATGKAIAAERQRIAKADPDALDYIVSAEMRVAGERLKKQMK